MGMSDARRRVLAVTSSATMVFAVRRYLVSSLLVFLAVGLTSVLVARDLAADIALGDASLRGAAFARTAVSPLVDNAFRTGDPSAKADLARVVNARISDGSIIHVKLWDPTGRIVWSDEGDIVGRTFPLDTDVAELFGTSGVTADVSDLRKNENVGEQASGRLVEVYAGMTDAQGSPMVFESYWSATRMDSDAQTILIRTTVLTVGAMLLLFVALLPLAVTLARRVDRAHAQRAAFQRQAMAAADLERQRVVEQLHDGLIQDLSSLGYAIPTLLRSLQHDAEPARALLRSIDGQLGHHVASLRNLIRDVYPPDLEADGLLSAVEGLARQTEQSGVDVRVSVSPSLETSADTAALVYRIVREALRNVTRHADATTVSVVAEIVDSRARVRVTDDGVGIGDTTAGEGHLGLRLLADALRAVGGTLDVASGPQGGTVVDASFPVSLLVNAF